MAPLAIAGCMWLIPKAGSSSRKKREPDPHKMPSFTPLWKTTATLGVSGSVNSGTEYFGVMNMARLVGSVFADQAGTLTINWSNDNANNDIPDTVVSVVASTKTFLNIEVRAPYCKVTYANGAGGSQTVFRLYIYAVDWASNLTVT